ncbi:MAG: VCBS repeat-containing protein [Pirellulales bacterium]
MAVAPARAESPNSDGPWNRHVIDDGLDGADGIRWADVNGDGAMDVATGWEESGRIRLCLNPGRTGVRKRWRSVEVGQVASPEDAVLVDIDGDGAMDVVSSCEGNCKTVYVHWGPRDRSRLLEAAAWRTQAFSATAGKQMWMFALPAQVDGRRGVDIIVGSKGEGGSVSWLEAPADARDLPAWRLHAIRSAGWIMSLVGNDLDGDGDIDVILSDRKGGRRGVFWLENPGGENASRGGSWAEHAIGAIDEEVMFIDLADFNRDGRLDVIATAKPRKAFIIQQPENPRSAWTAQTFALPGNVGRAKAIRAADIDLDGRLDLIFSCEGASGMQSGVSWYHSESGRWLHRDVSGHEGVKFDLIELIDLDADGDLDIVTTEEKDDLGVVWYENPTRPAARENAEK